MRGGSVASSAVANLVSAQAYDNLTKNFSNYTNAGKCGGAKKCRARACQSASKKCQARACQPRSKRGGSASDAISAVSHSFTNALKGWMSGSKEGFDVFKSEPAAYGSNTANLRGYSNAKSGGTFKNLKEYMNVNSYSVRNRRGGSADASKSLSLNYDAIKSTSPVDSSTSRATPFEVDRMVSYQDPTSLQPMRNIVEYGGVADVDTAKMPFAYAGVDRVVAGGAWRRKPAAKKPAAKKPAAKKPAAKKPAAKKPAAH